MVHYAVLGGGIAGVCCVEELCRLCPNDQVTLVSASSMLKGVANVVRLTNSIEEFQVVERSLTDLAYANLRVIRDQVTGIDTASKALVLESGERVQYDKLCIATGAKPKLLARHECVVTVRDTQSIQQFAQRLQGASRILVVGNGAIAMELVGADLDVDVVWVLKHAHIGDALFDVDAAQHLLDQLQRQHKRQEQQDASSTADQERDAVPAADRHSKPAQPAHPRDEGAQARARAACENNSLRAVASSGNGACPSDLGAAQARGHGHAAGPRWLDELPKGRKAPGLPPRVVLESNVQVQRIMDRAPSAAEVDQARPESRGSATGGRDGRADSWPVFVELSNGKVLGTDLVVSAIGVEPNTQWLPGCIERAADQGLSVGQDLQTSVPDIYAAGDCCTVRPGEQAPHWFQMRLWTQARLMGMYAAHCMAGLEDGLGSGFNFELFTHVTRFMGQKVVLLGLYNGQKLKGEPASDVLLYSRDAGDSFVRVLLLRGRMQGAVLIGETDMEEMCENLILDGLDISSYGPALLDPDFELDHVFD